MVRETDCTNMHWISFPVSTVYNWCQSEYWAHLKVSSHTGMSKRLTSYFIDLTELAHVWWWLESLPEKLSGSFFNGILGTFSFCFLIKLTREWMWSEKQPIIKCKINRACKRQFWPNSTQMSNKIKRKKKTCRGFNSQRPKINVVMFCHNTFPAVRHLLWPYFTFGRTLCWLYRPSMLPGWTCVWSTVFQPCSSIFIWSNRSPPHVHWFCWNWASGHQVFHHMYSTQ